MIYVRCMYIQIFRILPKFLASKAAVAAAAADALAEQQSMTLEQQAVAAAQAALTSGNRSGMCDEA